MNAHETRHPNWIKVEPADGAIKAGDRYRVEYADGDAVEYASATHDALAHRDFDAGNVYYVWPRPEPEPEPEKPYRAIPEGKENAAVMAVGTRGKEPVIGTYYILRDALFLLDSELAFFYVDQSYNVTSAVPVTAAPTDALETLRAAWLLWRDSGATHGSVAKAANAFFDAVDGAGA